MNLRHLNDFQTNRLSQFGDFYMNFHLEFKIGIDPRGNDYFSFGPEIHFGPRHIHLEILSYRDGAIMLYAYKDHLWQVALTFLNIRRTFFFHKGKFHIGHVERIEKGYNTKTLWYDPYYQRGDWVRLPKGVEWKSDGGPVMVEWK